ncbi:MAG TPA: hypothetical protein VH561_11135 [Micromonosporaceae bacterium]
MTVGSKLQIKPGMRVVVLKAPDGVDLELPADVTMARDAAEADAVIAFAVDSAAVDAVAAPAIQAAREDRLAWIAYPKAGQLGTDLNRDVLARLVTRRGAQPVRQVSIDDVWSALRFRP